MLRRGLLSVRPRAAAAPLPGPLSQSLRWGRVPPRRDPDQRSGAEHGALERMYQDETTRELSDIYPNEAPAPSAVIVRRHNGPARAAGSLFPQQAYPGHPHNFTPLRAVSPSFSALDRAARDVAWESRFDLLKRAIAPRYMGEGRGTPRREIQDGLVGGVRVRPVQNPYVRLKAAQRYRLNTWPSRNWRGWRPDRAHIRGSRRRYRLPEDITPYKDELGEWHPPRVSGRYKADIEKQYYVHTLPWVWANDYFQGKQHFMDREPRGMKRWYKREFRKAQVAEAMKHADTMIEEHRKERRESKRLSWIETMLLEFTGEQTAAPYIRQRRVQKM